MINGVIERNDKKLVAEITSILRSSFHYSLKHPWFS